MTVCPVGLCLVSRHALGTRLINSLGKLGWPGIMELSRSLQLLEAATSWQEISKAPVPQLQEVESANTLNVIGRACIVKPAVSKTQCHLITRDKCISS